MRLNPIVCGLLAFGSVTLYAGAPAPAPGTTQPQTGVSSPAPVSGSRVIQVFDDRVFDFGKPSTQEPSVSVSPQSGAARERAPAPNYTSEDRKNWIRNCASAREQGGSAFNDCYKQQEQKANETLQRRLERKQSAPEGNKGALENLKLND